MTPESAAEVIRLDKAHHWHPFTQMQEWNAVEHEPLILTGGEGAWLTDQRGRRYLDGNSSIWTNIHGHGHPVIAEAIRDQLGKVAHVSALGFANEPAARLAAELAGLWPEGTLSRVFFSDDGSTAIECALKMALQFFQMRGEPGRRRFAAFEMAYHGDTMGAASLGGIPAYHERFRGHVMEACRVGGMEDLEALAEEEVGRLAGVVIEPLIMGAAGMRLWPVGMLRRLREWCTARGVLLIADEVMTGFGRTGKLFACEHEGVVPDMVAVAKGLTGGFMPLAATMTTETVFGAFLGRVEEMKTFFYGHSYSGHALGCAAALASLEVFRRERTLERLGPLMEVLGRELGRLRDEQQRYVGEVRQCGFIAGIDVVRDAATGERWDWREQMGMRVCVAARKHGLLTRPVRDTLVVMLPLCCTEGEVELAVRALGLAIGEACGGAGV